LLSANQNNIQTTITNCPGDSLDEMDVDISPLNKSTIKSGIERMLELGRELLQMSLRLEKKYQNTNDDLIAQNRKMMEVKRARELICK
jgi:hypothetical protein